MSYDNTDARKLLIYGFIPMIFIAALTVFVRCFYHSDVSQVALLQQSIVCFIKYLVTVYIAGYFFSIIMPLCVDGAVNDNKYHTFIILSLSLVVILNIVQNCIPVELPLLHLVIVYIVYVMWRGLRYLTISFNGVIRFLILDVLTIILPPYVIQLIFNVLVPEF